MRVILFFIDGLGLGPAGENNPLSTTSTPCLNQLLDKHSLTIEAVGTNNQVTALYALDANLGVPRLPQSATGQTTLLTGINAAKSLGRHLRGFPNEALRKILATEGILKKVLLLGKSPVFINGYRPEFFTQIEEGERFYSATTLMNLYTGLHFHSFDDMAAGLSVYSDVTNEVLHDMGFDVPFVQPEDAGEIVARRLSTHHFVLFEYFLTDMVAHKQNREKAAYSISVIDRFLCGIITHIDLSDTLLIITSDHGNIEDLSTSSHTANPVPFLLIGKRPLNLPVPHDLTGVTPYIINILSR